MFEGTIPQLPNILIEKDGNLSGRFTVRDLPNCSALVLDSAGSLPFASTRLDVSPSPDIGGPGTARQHLFEACAHFIRLSYDGLIAPYRFRDQSGSAWRMDKSSAYWLLQSGRWELVASGDIRDFGLRLLTPG